MNISSNLFKRPSSLFSKIFSWFCIYILTVFAAGIWISFTSVDLSSTSKFVKKISNNALFLYGQTLAEKYEKEGRNSAVQFLGHIQDRGDLKIFFFDGQGNEICGRSPCGFNEAQIKNALNNKEDNTSHTHKGFHKKISLMRRLMGESGKKYLIVAEPVHNFFVKIFSRYTISRLIIFLIAAGCFSYFISRYLTTPIRILQNATRKLAEGDLSTRIGPQKRRRRDELVDLADDFDRMAEKIEMLENQRRRFLADISHELRSPLARLNMAVEMSRRKTHSEISDYLNRIDLESERLNEIIDRLLATTRRKDLVETDDPTLIQLNALLVEILEDADFEARGRHCSVKIVSETDIELKGIRHLIKSALENIVFNAIRYTEEGTCTEISMTKKTKSGSPWALITIRDHGKGVPEEHLRKIFEPFYRVDGSRDRRSGGTGLGLAIADRAIRFHHGTVTASNADDGGLIVEVTMPLSGLES